MRDDALWQEIRWRPDTTLFRLGSNCDAVALLQSMRRIVPAGIQHHGSRRDDGGPLPL